MDTILHASVIDRHLLSVSSLGLSIKVRKLVLSQVFRLSWFLYLLLCCLFLSVRFNEKHSVMEQQQLYLFQFVPQAVLHRQSNVNWSLVSEVNPSPDLSTLASNSTVITNSGQLKQRSVYSKQQCVDPALVNLVCRTHSLDKPSLA